MARVISIINAKGGTGKTTTAVNLGAYLAVLGQKTLLIDFDPQFNATIGLGITYKDNETIYHALLADQDIESVIKPTLLSNLEVFPSSADLAGALVELVNLPNRESYLKNFIDKVSSRYDFILIDLGPNLNLLTINGLIASDEVLLDYDGELNFETVDTVVLTHIDSIESVNIDNSLLKTLYLGLDNA